MKTQSYTFGRYVTSVDEAEKVLINAVKQGKFDLFLNSIVISIEKILKNDLSCVETCVLGIDSDIILENMLDTSIADEIKHMEDEQNMLYGSAMFDLDEPLCSVIVDYIFSETYSYIDEHDKLLLLAVGFNVECEDGSITSYHITV